MTRISFTTRFFIKNRYNNDHLYVRIIVNRKSSEISLKRTVDLRLWDDKRQQFKGGSEVSQTLNHYMNDVRGKLIAIHTHLTSNEEYYDSKIIKNIFLGNELRKHFVIKEFDIHNEKIKVLANENKEYSIGTYKRFKTARNHLNDFIRYKGSNDLVFGAITSEWIHDYEYFLKTQKNISHNTSLRYIKLFKKIFGIALRNGWVKKDPFTSFKIRFQTVNREHLSLSEIKTIKEKELHTERLDQVRDVFLFCCLTGFRYSDVKELTKHDIHINTDGTKSIIKKIKKTKGTVRIPLIKTALEIINKYEDDFYCKVKGLLLPVVSNQNTNAYLKEIATLCGIEKNLTFHIARHTFATVFLELGISMESVKAMLGHSDITTTQIYGKITDKKLMEEMDNLKTKIKL